MKTSLSAGDPAASAALGRVPWLEASQTHAHANEEVRLRVRWWPPTAADTVNAVETFYAYAVGPSGRQEPAAVDETIRFTPSGDGLYQAVFGYETKGVLYRTGDYRPGTLTDHPDAVRTASFTRYAQCNVLVGHHPGWSPGPSGTILEIRAAAWRHWRAGDILPLTVVFEGQTLKETPVNVVVMSPAGDSQWTMVTGPDGALAVRTTQPGRYLVVARHRAPGTAHDGAHERWFAAAAAFLVAK